MTQTTKTVNTNMDRINLNAKLAKKYSPEENLTFATSQFFNPYGFENFEKYAFVDSKYFSKELSHTCHGDNNLILIVVDKNAVMADLNETEKVEYKAFWNKFVSMHSAIVDESADDCSLCFIINTADRKKYVVAESQYFDIGIYSHSEDYPVESGKVWLDNFYTEWLPTVKAYAKVLKEYKGYQSYAEQEVEPCKVSA